MDIDVSHPRAFATILQKENRARYTGIYNDGFMTDEEVEKFISSTEINDNLVEQYFVRWKKGESVIYQTQTPQWQPFDVVITTTKNIHHFRVDTTKIYKAMLDRICDFMEKGRLMAKITDLTETIKIYLAGKKSKENKGEEVKLIDLKTDDLGFDGNVFEKEYAAKNKK